MSNEQRHLSKEERIAEALIGHCGRVLDGEIKNLGFKDMGYILLLVPDEERTYFASNIESHKRVEVELEIFLDMYRREL